MAIDTHGTSHVLYNNIVLKPFEHSALKTHLMLCSHILLLNFPVVNLILVNNRYLVIKLWSKGKFQVLQLNNNIILLTVCLAVFIWKTYLSALLSNEFKSSVHFFDL